LGETARRSAEQLWRWRRLIFRFAVDRKPCFAAPNGKIGLNSFACEKNHKFELARFSAGV